MSKIEKLIKEKCPNGVEYIKLNKILKSYSSGLNPRQNFKLNEKDAELYYVTVKEITTGKISFSDKTDKITKEAWNKIQNRSKLEINDVLLSGIGTIGKVALVDIPVDNWNCSESVILLKPKQDIINPKYLVHLLRSSYVQDQWSNQSVGSTLKGLRKENVLNTKIALPPIEVQEEIVRILDQFNKLEAELEAELEARKSQYIFYRDKIFKFENRNDVQWMKLGDIKTDIYRGNGIKRDEVSEDGIPCVRYGEIYTSYNIWFDNCNSHTSKDVVKNPKTFTTNDLLFAITGESVEEISKTIAYTGKETCYAGGDIVVMKHNQNGKYLSYALSTNDAIRQKGKGKVKSKVVHSNVPSIEEIIVPIVSLEEQERIVKKLDSFYNLITNFTYGIPAEIEARRKQYEYYRNKLLNFEEVSYE